MSSCWQVNDEGYKALDQIAQKDPELFLEPNPERLREEMEKRAGNLKLWDASIPLATSLASLNEVQVGGPDTDARYTPILREALADASVKQLADVRFWLSLNCFALSRYVPMRWSSSNIKNQYSFIQKHYFQFDREGNAAMRLWWLGELAERIATHTENFSKEAMLELLSSNRELYHQSLDRPYLMANSRLMAFIWELAHQGNPHLFKKPYPNQWLKSLNIRAATLSLDLLADGELRELIQEVAPRPKSMGHPAGGSVPPALRVLSLGGGVQSTVLCLMAEEGRFGEKPDCAIFADTDWEPRAVYENIRWLRSQVSFPIYITDNGRSLRQDVLRGVNTNGRPWLTIPAYLGNEDGEPAGINWRQCTSNYKIVPIHKKIRSLLGLNPRQQISSETRVEMWLGLTTDEYTRVKPSRDWWITLRYPLIDDLPLDREECQAWFAERYPQRTLPRSACVACPFHSSASWLHMQEQEPEQFAESIALDEKLRSGEHAAGKLFRKRVFLHHRRIPLREAIQLDRQEADAHNPFLDECEGYCGL